MGQRFASSAFTTKHPQLAKSLVALVVLLVVILIGYASGVHIATIEDREKIQAEAKAKEFNAASYVDAVWESQVIPTILEKAVDFPTLMAEIKADQHAAELKYGHTETGAYNFMTKGQGKVIAVDATSSSRTLDLDIEPYDGQRDLTIQVGPVIRTNFSLRDSTGVITFNSVGNQIEYGRVNTELNKRVAALFKDLDVAGLQDKVVEFYGTFTLDNINTILLTPVQLTVVGG